MKKVTITTFTDPMMGLSYESEPVFRKLETHYEGRIEFRYVMAGLVRDVSDFMTDQEREETERDAENGIRSYCRRLAGIYKSEEAIGGIPINMEGFHLFDAQHRSSYPLNIAYEAAKLTEPEKADQFLYQLRYATITETRQTTREDEILRAARKTGLDEGRFRKALHDGSAEAAFLEDLKYTASLGIRRLPAYLVRYGEESILINALAGFDAFSDIISRISGGKIAPQQPELSEEGIREFLHKHPLISEAEFREAFVLTKEQAEEYRAFYSQEV